MVSKSKIKFVRSLQLRKYRQKYHKIVVEGTKCIVDALRETLIEFDEIYATEDWEDAFRDELVKTRGEITIVTQAELNKVSGFKQAQPVLGIARMPARPVDPHMPQRTLCLYLDAVRDPGNLGTILRIADWFGFQWVYLSDDCVDIYNPKVIQASMSSVFRVQCQTYSLYDLVAHGHFPVFGTVPGGRDIGMISIPSHGMIVFGNEAHGVRPEYLGLCTERISVSSKDSLGAESLNVAAAAAVVCAHFRNTSD